MNNIASDKTQTIKSIVSVLDHNTLNTVRIFTKLHNFSHKKFELKLTRRAKAYSIAVLICNCFHENKTGQHRKNNDFYGATALWRPLVQVSLNLENRDVDRRNLRSMLKISYAPSPCLSQLISAQFAFELCLAARNGQKIHKTLFLRSRSSKVIEFGGNREPVYDFLLVINSNLGPILHRYWDTATYWLKIANFSHTLSFSALVRGDPVQIYGKALRLQKLL